MASGIYEIVNLISGKRYVGSSGNLSNRGKQHFERLRENTHDNTPMQQEWNEHGETAFEFLVVQECHSKDLIRREQERIDGYDFEALYNCHPIAGSSLGFKHSEETKAKIAAPVSNPSAETRAKMSAARMGHVVSDETKAKISTSNSNPSLETRAKRSAALKGRKFSDETRAKISARNSNPSPETRAKMSKAKKGNAISDETKAKISASLKGRKLSDEARAKISAAHKGRKYSEETRAKISAAAKKRYERERAEAAIVSSGGTSSVDGVRND